MDYLIELKNFENEIERFSGMSLNLKDPEVTFVDFSILQRR